MIARPQDLAFSLARQAPAVTDRLPVRVCLGIWLALAAASWAGILGLASLLA